MIRKMTLQDIDRVSALWLAGNRDAHDFIPSDYWEAYLPALKEQLLQAEVYLYEKEGMILGFAGMQEDYLAGIFVTQEARSAGIGKALLDFLKEGRTALSLNVYQKNEAAVRFYQREGFRAVSAGTDEETGEAEYRMSWQAGCAD